MRRGNPTQGYDMMGQRSTRRFSVWVLHAAIGPALQRGVWSSRRAMGRRSSAEVDVGMAGKAKKASGRGMRGAYSTPPPKKGGPSATRAGRGRSLGGGGDVQAPRVMRATRAAMPMWVEPKVEEEGAECALFIPPLAGCRAQGGNRAQLGKVEAWSRKDCHTFYQRCSSTGSSRAKPSCTAFIMQAGCAEGKKKKDFGKAVKAQQTLEWALNVFKGSGTLTRAALVPPLEGQCEGPVTKPRDDAQASREAQQGDQMKEIVRRRHEKMAKEKRPKIEDKGGTTATEPPKTEIVQASKEDQGMKALHERGQREKTLNTWHGQRGKRSNNGHGTTKDRGEQETGRGQRGRRHGSPSTTESEEGEEGKICWGS
ncbi:hypothetical protein GOP47_0022754 [Adiantum capillus-veneris]|uniref:Uncharacterized protein n=1 Tax=Adiantum capillus-veneris TaxID=13818 RepID=A0A9D4Z5T8_ADICA|nr:hypothetical protein GOP47_0022754 [Adiantum capillus-veneris]